MLWACPSLGPPRSGVAAPMTSAWGPTLQLPAPAPIAPGTELEVELTGDVITRGTLVSYDQVTGVLAIETSTGEVERVPLGEVERLEIDPGATEEHALAGVGVAFAIGLPVTLGLGIAFGDDSFGSIAPLTAALSTALVLAPLGALIGANVPNSRLAYLRAD